MEQWQRTIFLVEEQINDLREQYVHQFREYHERKSLHDDIKKKGCICINKIFATPNVSGSFTLCPHSSPENAWNLMIKTQLAMDERQAFITNVLYKHNV